MNLEKTQITRVAAYGIVRDESKILLCRLSKPVPRHPGKWTLPGGGIEFCEDPEAAMVREVREETGLIVRPSSIAGVNSRISDRPERTMHSIRIIYFTDLLGGTLTHEVDGTTDFCQWWSFKDAAALPMVDLAEVGLALATSNQEGGGA